MKGDRPMEIINVDSKEAVRKYKNVENVLP